MNLFGRFFLMDQHTGSFSLVQGVGALNEKPSRLGASDGHQGLENVTILFSHLFFETNWKADWHTSQFVAHSLLQSC